MNGFRAFAFCAALVVTGAVLAVDQPPDAAKGKAIFQRCGVCHSVTDARKMAPSLKGLFKKEKLTSGKKPTEPNVRAKIEQGGNGMPPYRDMLTDREKADLIAYLKTL